MSEHSARRTVYERSEAICETCGNQPGQSVHHRKNRSQGGDWTPANLLHVCGDGTRGCHGWIGANPAESYRNGWLVRSTDEPAALPVLYRGRESLLDDHGRVITVEGLSDDQW